VIFLKELRRESDCSNDIPLAKEMWGPPAGAASLKMTETSWEYKELRWLVDSDQRKERSWCCVRPSEPLTRMPRITWSREWRKHDVLVQLFWEQMFGDCKGNVWFVAVWFTYKIHFSFKGNITKEIHWSLEGNTKVIHSSCSVMWLQNIKTLNYGAVQEKKKYILLKKT